jgi:hypothetical protein
VIGILVVHLFATPELRSASAMVAWLSFAQFCATAIVLPQPAYYFSGQIYWITAAFMLALPLQVGAVIAGFGAFGPNGAAVASGVGSAFVVVALAAFASRRSWPGADKLWTRWCARGLLLAAMIAAGSALRAFDGPGPTLWWGALALAAWLAVSGPSLGRIRVVLGGGAA